MRCLDTSPVYTEIPVSLATTAKSVLDASRIALLFCTVCAFWGLIVYLALQAA